MILFSTTALVAFWFLVFRLWVFDGAKIPLIFIALWSLGLVVVAALRLGGHVFMGFEAVLGLALIILNGCKEPPPI
ncbi:MAG: hypothetical protein JW993_03860 [Sedimentisphaerales bacterium]|nr:hypothetical protein [Sedimentisphaerales bacterium]